MISKAQPKITVLIDSKVFRKPIAFSCGLETQANGQLLSNCQTNELQSLVGDFLLELLYLIWFRLKQFPPKIITFTVSSAF